jgi:YL1 nuclear protein C-terminal domain/YL1 nuclear protein
MMERERRATAGRRMTSLVGKALDDDEAFWGHDTWNDEDDNDGNDSFRSSDEDSEMKRDEFDSDFDDSEDEENVNADEEERGRQEEALLDLEERQMQRGKLASASSASYKDVASKASRPMAMRKQKGRQAVTGHGLNAGIVLNVPPTTSASENAHVPNAAAAAAAASVHGFTAAEALQPKPLLLAAAAASSSSKTGRPTPLSIARTKPRRAITKPKRAAAELAARQMASAGLALAPPAHAQQRGGPPSPGASSTSLTTSGRASKKRKSDAVTTAGSRGDRESAITQEQMILEAVHETEPENERWLLARERRMQESDAQQQQSSNNQASHHHHRNATIVEKFVSRRGYPNIISFPEMDHVPPILQQQQQQHGGRRGNSQSSKRNKALCVITGKLAKYRDPKTGHGYHDLEAFRELRRRHDAGEPIVPSSAPLPSSGNDGPTVAIAPDTANVQPDNGSAVLPADNGANKANGSAAQAPIPVANASISSSSSSSTASTSKSRIHIRAPPAISPKPPATAIDALPQPQPQPHPQPNATEASSFSQIPNSVPNSHLPQPPPLPTFLAANAAVQQPTIQTSHLQAGTTSAASALQAASESSIASAGSEIAAPTPTTTLAGSDVAEPGGAASASATSATAPPLSVENVPPNVVPRPGLSSPRNVSSLPPPPPSTTVPSASSSNNIVSTEPVTPRPCTTTESSSEIAALPAPGSLYPPHPSAGLSLPSPLPELTIRASPRQRKPSAKVLHGSP